VSVDTQIVSIEVASGMSNFPIVSQEPGQQENVSLRKEKRSAIQRGRKSATRTPCARCTLFLQLFGVTPKSRGFLIESIALLLVIEFRYLLDL